VVKSAGIWYTDSRPAFLAGYAAAFAFSGKGKIGAVLRNRKEMR